jgi:cytoskeletal protein RodZ
MPTLSSVVEIGGGMELKPDQKSVDGVQSEKQPLAAENPIAVPQTAETAVESDKLKNDAQFSVDLQKPLLDIEQNQNQSTQATPPKHDEMSNSSPPQFASLGSSMSTSSLPLSQAQPSSNAQRPGERLRQARLLKGREIKDIATDLNIHVRILTAIEADDYKLLPEPAFIRGYLRAYGRLLGIDSDTLVLQFNEIYTSATGLSSNHSLENSPLQQLARLHSHTRKSNGWMLWLLVPIVLVVLVLILRPIVKRIMGSTSGAAAHTVILTDNTQTAHTPATSVPLSALPPVTSTQSLSDQLVLKLSKASDVNVQDSTGKTLISGTQGTAQPLTLNGVSPFSVTLADAAHVSLSLNGEHVDLAPYTLDGHASFRLSR